MSLATAKAALQSALQTTFETNGEGRTAAAAAQEVTDAIDAYVKAALVTVTIPIGTVLIGCTGPGVVPVPNPAPIPITGDPDATTGGLT